MLDERSLRRPNFRTGVEVRLADGQSWTFPAPPESSGDCPAGVDGLRTDPQYRAIVGAILEAEDRDDRLRAELALAIYLLGRNYRLGAAEYGRLLEYRPGDPALEAMQAAVGEVAAGHAREALRRADLQPTGTPAMLRRGFRTVPHAAN